MSSLGEFAKRYQLRVRRSEDRTLEIRGRAPTKRRPGLRKLDTYDERGLLALSISNPADLSDELRLSPQGWTWVKKRLQRAGGVLLQDGASEGCILIYPDDEELARAALQELGYSPPRRRRRSQAQQEHSRRALEKAQAVAWGSGSPER